MKYYRCYRICLVMAIFFSLSALLNMPTFSLSSLPTVLLAIAFIALCFFFRKKISSNPELAEEVRKMKEEKQRLKALKRMQKNQDKMTQEELYAYIDSQFPEEIDGKPRIRVYVMDISGVSHGDLIALKRLRQWDDLILKHIPENPFSDKAVAVYTTKFKQIGWIPEGSTYKPSILKSLRENEPIKAKLYKVTYPYHDDEDDERNNRYSNIPYVKIAVAWY